MANEALLSKLSGIIAEFRRSRLQPAFAWKLRRGSSSPSSPPHPSSSSIPYYAGTRAAGYSAKANKISLIIFSMALILLTSGCSTMYDWMRADPPEQTKFIDGNCKMVVQSPDFPFRMMWLDKSVDIRQYKKIMLSKVNLNHLSDDYNYWDKADTRRLAGDLNSDSKDVASYMEISFRNAITYDPKHRFKIVDAPGPDTLKLELAIIQLVPSKAELNVAENVVGIIVWPVAFLTVFNSGTTAFEGVLRDSQTGKIVCAFADREKDENAIFNIPGMTYYGNARYFTDRWSRQFVDFMNAKDYTQLKTDFPFKLIVF